MKVVSISNILNICTTIQSHKKEFEKLYSNNENIIFRLYNKCKN